MNNIIRFIGITKDARTAGPGKRLELFTKGCIRGVVSPCIGCFNKSTWTFEGQYRPFSIDEVVDIIDQDAWNRQVTFCGGEPILQARALGEVAKRLKEKDPTFHFVMYTMYKLDVLMKYGLDFTWREHQHEKAMLNQLKDYSSHYEVKETNEEGEPTRVFFKILTAEDVREVMRHIDLIVDGEYQHDKRLTIAEFMHDGGFIGSANQRVIFANKSMDNYDRNEYEDTDKHNTFIHLHSDAYMDNFHASNHCKACGHNLEHTGFCNKTCESRFEKREDEMYLISKARSEKHERERLIR